MFRQPTLSFPIESSAIKFAVDKLAANFARVLFNKTIKNYLESAIVREAFGQLDVGFKNALKNNLIRSYGSQHYIECKKDLSDDFYDLATLHVDVASTKVLAEINDEFEKLWILEQKRSDTETYALTIAKNVTECLDNVWCKTHVEFKVDYENVFCNVNVA